MISNLQRIHPHGSTKKGGKMTQLTLVPRDNPILEDQAVVTYLPSSVKSKLTPTLGKDFDLLNYKLDGKVDLEDIKEALDILDARVTLPSHDEIIQGITKLYALCAPSSDSDDTLKLRISAYTEKLAKYPRDAVLYVLDKAPEQNKWFPSWFDLKKELDHVTKHHRLIKSILQDEQFKLQYHYDPNKYRS